MQRVNDQMLECPVYLYQSEEDARQGIAYGGSGFLVGVSSGQGWAHVYAVTNSHVIMHGFTTVRLNSRTEQSIDTIAPDNWIHHPEGDDLAIAPIELDRSRHRFKFLSSKAGFFITKELEKEINLGLGDEALMVGRFLNIDETQSNSPLVRFGRLASSGAQKVDQGEDRNHFRQESFIVEIHSVSGFSGSPVFVSIPIHRLPEIGEEIKTAKMLPQVAGLAMKVTFMTKEYFLGIDWGSLQGGMAGVVPAWKLRDMLDLPEVVEMRKADEKRVGQSRGPRLDSAKPPSQKTRAPEREDRIDIPIPTRKQFETDLGKAIRKQKP
jgi:hypothetical protein